jgi:hypothetical protein
MLRRKLLIDCVKVITLSVLDWMCFGINPRLGLVGLDGLDVLASRLQ